MKTQKKINYKLSLNEEEYFNIEKGDEEMKTEQSKVSKVSKDVKKTIESNLWLSNEFPLSVNSFLTVLKTLSLSGNTSMQKIKDFMKHDSLKEVII